MGRTTDPGRGLGGPVARKEARKLRARRHRGRGTWFGLGMYGLVGWSIVIPTLGGVALGLWIDGRWPSRFSWTLMLLAAGLLLGCWNAWYWVSLEQEAIRDEMRETEEGERP
ncbi:MAG: AtpZ/AtpI family protein [Vicinamibacterales bacterium]|nr:AtpZ/AtpI family protein [Vicinamibacterales bacterium]